MAQRMQQQNDNHPTSEKIIEDEFIAWRFPDLDKDAPKLTFNDADYRERYSVPNKIPLWAVQSIGAIIRRSVMVHEKSQRENTKVKDEAIEKAKKFAKEQNVEQFIEWSSFLWE